VESQLGAVVLGIRTLVASIQRLRKNGGAGARSSKPGRRGNGRPRSGHGNLPGEAR